MAGDAVVGALRVVLGMDTASYEDGAKKAAKATTGMADAITAVFAGTTLSNIVERLFDRITHAFKEGIIHSIEFADQMGKTAQKVGVSVEQLSGLKVAADLSDVSMETLTTALGKLSKSMVDASKNGGEVRDQFEKLGVNTSNLAKTNVVDVLAQIADKFETTKDGAVKVNAVLALMGKGAKDLIPLLNEGGGSLKEFAKVAQNMGLVIDKVQADQSQKFNDNLKLLKLAGEGLANMVTAALLPALVNLSNLFVNIAKDGSVARNTADTIVSTLKTLVVTAAGAAVTLGFLKDALSEFATTQKEVRDGTKSVDEMGGALARVGAAFKAIDDITKVPLFDQGGGADFKPPSEKAAELQRRLTDVKNSILDLFRIPPNITVHKTLEDLEATASKTQKEMEKLQLTSRVLSGEFANLPKGLPELAVNLELTAKNGSKLSTTFAGLSPTLQGFAQQLAIIQAQQLIIDTRTPFENYQVATQNLMATFNALPPAIQNLSVVQDAFYKKGQENASKLAQQNAEAAKLVVGGWAEAFKTLAESNKQYAGVAKALAIVMATINTYEAATKALASTILPYPLNLVAAAGTVAAGIAQVAKIQSTNFATGGSFKVGGAGGIDSQLISFKATPGEMVDVRTPGQQATTTEVVLRGTRPSDIFTRDTIAVMIDGLNSAYSDGYRLRFAS
jgi:hypothetical protein